MGTLLEERWRQVASTWEPTNETERALVAALEADDIPIPMGAQPVLTMFSSSDLLDRTGSPDLPREKVLFLDVLASWPEDDHMLCLDPGSRTEMILPGEAVAGLIDSIAEVLAGTVPDSEGN